jgi:hypothetical protein
MDKWDEGWWRYLQIAMLRGGYERLQQKTE